MSLPQVEIAADATTAARLAAGLPSAALGDPSADAPGSLVERERLMVIADRSARPQG